MRPNREHLTSHPLGDGDLRGRAQDVARKVVASHNPLGGYNLRNLSRPPSDYEPGGERYPGSDRQFDDLTTAILRRCDPRTESCPPGSPIPSGGGRRRCRPCRRGRCRR